MDEVIAIGLGDCHLTLRPPLARAEEPDWLEAMRRVWRRVSRLVRKHKAFVICAGDVFDRAAMPPELINWALENLPGMYGIPGNHDLPYHREDLEHQSAWGTLVRAGKITPLGAEPIFAGPFALYGKPLGGKTPKRLEHHCDGLKLKHVLVTHQYLWTEGTGYRGAKDETKLRNAPKRFAQFDVVLVGDNHQAFKKRLKSGTRVVNCGTLMRRKSSEINYRPRVALLWRSGKVTWEFLPTGADIITELVDDELEESNPDEIADFIDGLSRLEALGLSFRDALIEAAKQKKVSKQVRDVILEALDD